MSDFTSGFWSIYISIITLASIVACAVLLVRFTTRRAPGAHQPEMVGHVWDENLEEYNNPLPRWWLWLFYLTLIFAVAYLVMYPGLGSFKGTLGWTSTGQFDKEQERAKERFAPVFAKFTAMDLKAVAADPQAREIGQRLFLNYCAACHASDARGTRGFPDLTDKDWQWGGQPEQIVATITTGRNAAMPPWPQLGPEGIRDVAHYVMSLSGMTHDSLRANRGQAIFQTNCAACHGPDGKGNPALGALNLTDEVWLYGKGETSIVESITKGRNGQMPAWGGFLGPEKVHLLAAYVYGLSNPASK